MPRGTFQLCIVMSLIGVSVLGGAFEVFDRWDGFPQSGQDIVLSIVTLLVMLGVMFLTTPALVVVIVLSRPYSSPPRLPAAFASLVRSAVRVLEPVPPPLSSLRI